MFVTKDFVFLHLPKTGGIFFETICLDVLGMDYFLRKRHTKYSDLPIEFKDKPTIGIWRDPWSWYASLYYFAKLDRNKATGDLIAIASEDFNLDFKKTLPRLLNPDDDFIKKYEEYFFANNGKIKDFDCMDIDSLSRAKSNNLSLLSFLVKEIFPEKLNIEWQVDTLRKDIFSFLGPKCEDRAKFREAMILPSLNVSNKPGLELIYNKEMIASVSEVEKDIIDRFSYKKPNIGIGQDE